MIQLVLIGLSVLIAAFIFGKGEFRATEKRVLRGGKAKLVAFGFLLVALVPLVDMSLVGVCVWVGASLAIGLVGASLAEVEPERRRGSR